MTEGVQSASGPACEAQASEVVYHAGFDRGYRYRLYDRQGTFRVSQAGIALGNHLIHGVREDELRGRILDVGTGSGVIALLLRGLGAVSVTAVDISAAAVVTAQQNELENFSDARIDFLHADLFPPAEAGRRQRYDLIVFNPPGWRAPSEFLKAELDRKRSSLDLEAMFYGDAVLLRFLHQLPDYLRPGGRAVIGFNSLVGIGDIMERSRSAVGAHSATTLHSCLLERREFPLLFYTGEWRQLRASLLSHFEQGRREYSACYVETEDSLNWFYEITEVTVTSTAAVSPGSNQSTDPEPPAGTS